MFLIGHLIDKPKSSLDSDERIRLQEYIMYKRQKMEQEKHFKDIEACENLEKKRRNLEKLECEIRVCRDHDVKKSKSKKRIKKRKSEKYSPKLTKTRQPATERHIDHRDDQDVEDQNYSALYREYRKIISSKRGITEEATGVTGATSKRKAVARPSSRNVNVGILENSNVLQETSNDTKQKRSKSGESKKRREINQKKQEIHQKFTELSERYQRNLENSIQAFENVNINRQPSGVHGVQLANEKNIDKLRNPERSSHRPQSAFENERSEAQKVIMEMETDNFSDNDYLKSDRMISLDRNDYPRSDRKNEALSERVYDTEGNLPEESAREIIEAAAIFIQKNYRGYRTRKLLRIYFERLYEDDLEVDKYQDDDIELRSRSRSKEEPEYEEAGMQAEEYRSSNDYRRNLAEIGRDSRVSNHKQESSYEEEEGEEDEEDQDVEDNYEERIEQELEENDNDIDKDNDDMEDDDNNEPEFLDPKEKKSIMHLLERYLTFDLFMLRKLL